LTLAKRAVSATTSTASIDERTARE
jgi:hypothetical protein